MPKHPHHLPTIPAAFLQFIAQALVTARKTKPMKQAELAERTGVTRQTIARMEKGDPNVAIGIYLTSAWILDVPLLPGLEINGTKSQNALTQFLQFLQQQLPQRISPKKIRNLDDQF